MWGGGDGIGFDIERYAGIGLNGESNDGAGDVE